MYKVEKICLLGEGVLLSRDSIPHLLTQRENSPLELCASTMITSRDKLLLIEAVAAFSALLTRYRIKAVILDGDFIRVLPYLSDALKMAGVMMFFCDNSTNQKDIFFCPNYGLVRVTANGQAFDVVKAEIE